MKYQILLLFTLIPGWLFSQIFVDVDATGNNDGSSWSNAFTDIGKAIEESEDNDELWIADGIYKCPPTSLTQDTFFLLNKNLRIYGGFSGFESKIEEKDAETNLVIFDGDQDGDDQPEDGQFNREDNNLHILVITDVVTNSTIIDGISFKGGTTAGQDGIGDERRGGGILSYGSPIISNCIFTENYGFFGGGIHTREDFADETTVLSCTFSNNYGNNGAGAYIRSKALLDNLVFEGNISTFRGAGMYITNHNACVKNCLFKNNFTVGSTGGAIQIRGILAEEPISVSISNCTFEGNVGRAGGGSACYDSLTTTTYIDCKFKNNTATVHGGAATTALGATSIFNNCLFMGNSAMDLGGAISSIDDYSSTEVESCEFLENTAHGGGAIGIIAGDEHTSLPNLQINNSHLHLNSSILGGGAIFLANVNASIINALITNNYTLEDEARGGGIAINVSDQVFSSTSLLNSTIAENNSNNTGGISIFGGGPTAALDLSMQNVLLANPDGKNFDIESISQGIMAIGSLGGNLSSDESISAFFIANTDMNDENPDFVSGPGGYDYYPSDDSPATNNGVPNGSPAQDLAGNDRILEVDIGALENQTVVNIKDYFENKTSITVEPNPIFGNEVQFELAGEVFGEITIEIIDNLGKVIHKEGVLKTHDRQLFTFTNLVLSHRVYHIKVNNNDFSSASTFVSIK